MANPEHLKILKRGVEEWNAWRKENSVRPNLSGADLSGVDLSGANLGTADLGAADLSEARLWKADLSKADLRQANLSKASLIYALLYRANLSKAHLREANLGSARLVEANLSHANLRAASGPHASLVGANLSKAHLKEADLSHANLREADLHEAHCFMAVFIGACLSKTSLIRADLFGAHLGSADLRGADLREANLAAVNLTNADLRHADLREAELSSAMLVQTKLQGTNLSETSVYGVAAWDLETDRATKQQGLIITQRDEPVVMVDDLKVAQFMYLLLNNEEIRNVIDTITSKVVLILGRFSEDRKPVLDALREELRERWGYVPVLFDFEKPASKDLTGTIETLARMARFIIADLTDPRSVPYELAMVVPHIPTTAVQPILLEGSEPHEMFIDLRRRHRWVLEPYEYESHAALIGSLGEVLAMAEERVIELRGES